MNAIVNKPQFVICFAAAVALLVAILPSGADDGPVKVRRVPGAPVAEEAAPRALPVVPVEPVVSASQPTREVPVEPARAGSEPLAAPADVAAVPAAPELVVKKATVAAAAPAVVDSAPVAESAAPGDELERARAMRPDTPAAPAPTKKEAGGKVSWTERYELGPGDTLNFGLHGQPTLEKLKVPVAPDWTISYLQAKRVSVRGLTIDELRVRIEGVLADFHRKPKLIVTPAELGSKKYTVLGKVKVNDTYKLDRPTTLLEAIAKAKGIMVGVSNSNATELADLKRSFVVRDGKKLPVDIERLYRTGDMTQNVQIEPGDYIYIASNVHNESYVFGSVVRPGTVPLNGNLTVMGAIAESGSYAEYAWKGRVLLIRGSVGSPEARVLNTRDILHGKEKDVLLEPGDIVYVHKRPWSYAEEILDVAIKAYIQAATAVAIQGDNSVSIGL